MKKRSVVVLLDTLIILGFVTICLIVPQWIDSLF